MKRYIIGISLLLSVGILFSSQASAMDVCGQEDSVRDVGSATLNAGTYDVYVKIPEAKSVTLAIKEIGSGTCAVVGQSIAAVSSWVKVGVFEHSSSNQIEVSLIDSDNENLNSLGNRPEVLFVDKAYDVEISGDHLEHDFMGERAIVNPAIVSGSEDTVILKRVSDVKNDAIRKVDYFADGQFIYSKQALEDFSGYINVSPSARVLSRIVYFHSGQVLTLEQTTTMAAPSLIGFAKQVYNQSSTLITILAVILSIIVIVEVVFGFLRLGERRRKWLMAHGFRQDVQRGPIGRWLNILAGTVIGRFIHIAGRLSRVTFPVILLFVSVAWLFFDMYAVDGTSMEPTLKNGSRVIVSKTAKTLAFLGNGSMQLSRGDIVVVDSAMSVLPISPDKKYTRSSVVKRVIGIPGDTVIVHDDSITILSKEGSRISADDLLDKKINRSVENRSIDVRAVLGKDEVFVVGDNRVESIDSRFYGPVKIDQIVGKVFYAQ